MVRRWVTMSWWIGGGGLGRLVRSTPGDRLVTLAPVSSHFEPSPSERTVVDGAAVSDHLLVERRRRRLPALDAFDFYRAWSAASSAEAKAQAGDVP